MTVKPAPMPAFVYDAITRHSLRMKAELLTLISLTVGPDAVTNDDFALMSAIDKHTANIAERFAKQPPDGIATEMPSVAERVDFAAQQGLFENEGARNFSAGIAEQLNPAADPAPLDAPTAVPAPPPPAAPIEEPPAPVGEVNPEIAQGIRQLAEEQGEESDEGNGPAFTDTGLRLRGHVRRQ